eukprot:TRINITY_DN257_c0_g1_i1.p2 TRINITY_DN257_c0_g1~~TRINITY_DN257_c0_g1_i1.p2  ORF type:complete len:177 (-),score=73.09 TRINITY_DN257_c0_g1_i1:284-814(-)
MLQEASAEPTPNHSLDGLLQEHCLPLMRSSSPLSCGDDFELDLPAGMCSQMDFEDEDFCSASSSSSSSSACDSPDRWSPAADLLMGPSDNFYEMLSFTTVEGEANNGERAFMLPPLIKPEELEQPTGATTLLKHTDGSCIEQLKQSSADINVRLSSILDGIQEFTSEHPDSPPGAR